MTLACRGGEVFFRREGFPRGLVTKNLPANAGDLGSIPGSGSSPGEGNDNPLQYSCLENPVDRGGWWAAVHGVAQSRTRLTRLSSSSSRASLVAQWKRTHLPMQETWVRSLGQEDPLENEMTTHSSTPAWEISQTGEPGGLQSLGSQSWTRLTKHKLYCFPRFASVG